MSIISLRINQALLIVNKINISYPIGVYYQLEECFGCPPDKLAPHTTFTTPKNDSSTTQEQFVIDTRHNFHLEFRQLDSVVPSRSNKIKVENGCRLDNLALNSYGQYRVDVSPSAAAALAATAAASAKSEFQLAGSAQTLACSLETIEPGECLFCPIAILIFLLCSIVASEQIYTRFWRPKRNRAQQQRQQQQQQQQSQSKLRSELKTEGLENGHIDQGGKHEAQEAQEAQETNASSLDSHLAGASVAEAHTESNNLSSVEPSSRAPSVVAAAAAKGTPRIESLDVFRGLTIAGMIFVNYGGAGYTILEHKAWNGITLADFVFPFFIFSMGASIPIATRTLVFRHPDIAFHTMAKKILRRSLVLGLLGVCLNSKWVNYEQSDGLKRLRLTGVLQRFAVSYLVVAMIHAARFPVCVWIRAQGLSSVPYLNAIIGHAFEWLTAFNSIAIYVYLTFFFQYDPNCPAGYLGPGGMTDGGKYANCTGGSAAWIDRQLLGTDHLYNDHEVKEIFKTKVSHDPEGVLGYTTSILLTLIGLQCGRILRLPSLTHRQKLFQLGAWAAAMAVVSMHSIPINKRLWSLTFVSVTALAAISIIMLLYALIDVYSCKHSILIRLLSAAGKNSIFLYVGHSVLYGMLPWWFPLGPQAKHLHLLFRLTWSTLVWLLIANYMASRRLFIKV